VRQLSTEISLAHAAFNEQQSLATANRLRKPARQIGGLTIALIAICAAGIVVTLILSLRFGVSLTRRITRLADNARRLAVGADAQPISGHDEIAELDLVYREMMHRTQREHDTVITLQRALLPQTLPSVTGVRLDAAYVPAYGGAEIGGDWYDVFPITERLLGISVGDVAGHGLRAATIMGQARQALRTASYIAHNPGVAVAYVNRLICRSEADVMVTAFFGTLDLSDGTLQYAVAGHPPPMFVRTGGSVESLPGRGFVLGVDPNVTFEVHETKADIGSAVVFFTDGLIEADRDYASGLEKLRDAVEDEYRNASGNIAQAIVSRIFSHRRPRDDVALLFLGVTALGASTVQPQRMIWNLDATLERSARRAKRAVLWHLGEVAGGRVDLSAAELVVNELLGNVARHSPGPAELVLEWRNNGARVAVSDRGQPFEPPSPTELIDLFAESGRGLFLIRSVAEQLTVEWTGEGNRVSAVLPLNGAVLSQPVSP
jgi:serine phosphatase RsbU (regulator of sigma subunit)/anti-sigma regulatory factor (Ser/Thr protein kinase)